ncbi:30S ribosomal protein S20 [Mageeibacillus indolicus]|uniref:Small ribosomal subunit protein bS20 n=2 Tax=Mageeibacillus indolicus TaxID=884684 RepID=D3R330_MAGIU|nr:30S ribosomal protein S20 [Mageeibacillus indolicus]ADC91440.1 ribosomal protein S20 [Mageeibacillus indolicus UPII9-5]KFA56822.1 30S ribosomal protein S20 [Mageeibacillus indolicus 0009-5]PNH18107.1 30S ribosomal protein S20 [Mageeibacillus indolicus]
MPNIKSAIKRVKVLQKKAAANKIKRSEIRTAVKKARVAVAESNEHASEIYRSVQKKLDQAACKGRLHKNTVARRKSALAKALNAAK